MSFSRLSVRSRIFVFLFALTICWSIISAAPTAASDALPTFSEPTRPFSDDILKYAWYGRLEDNANVYSSPSYESPIVRNVGDGFVFATILREEEVAGKKWYLINQDEYIVEDDITLIEKSEFQGVQVNHQPIRPFGWIVSDIRPSRAIGADADPDFKRLPRYSFFEVYDVGEDIDGWVWYNIGSGRWIQQTNVSLVEVSHRPADVPIDGHWVEVDLYEQTFAAYEGQRLVYAGLTSSGLTEWPTNEGLFTVWSRWSKTKMDGAEGKEDFYYLEDVPHTMYFDQDIALHGAYWHDRFGYKSSHGCVNLAPYDAEWLFDWSHTTVYSGYTQEDDAESALHVWVHSSDPADFLKNHRLKKLNRLQSRSNRLIQ